MAEHDEMHAHDVGMGTFVLALTLGIFCRAFGTKLTRLPYTCLVLILGLVYGYIIYTEVGKTGHDMFSLSADLWINISPEAILTIILPILIFGSSFATDLHLFLQQLGPILTLAGPAVIINTVILGLFIKYVLPYEWDWATAFMMASILSATDPVAVVAILKELGVAESLSTLIDGESLLNDGVAIVLYSIFSRLVFKEEEFSGMETFKESLILCLGGPAIGVAVGVVASTVLTFLINDVASEVAVTIVSAYGAYLLAEMAESSGVLSMVAAGLFLSYHGLGRISAPVMESLHSFWEMAEWLANTLIFFLSGLIMADKALVSSTVHGVDWAYLLLLYVVLNVTRAFGVMCCFPVISRGPYGLNWKQAMLLSWGGLRGAVSLTLSIAVSQEESLSEETRARISFLIAGCVLLTILVNGTTCKPLLNRLGLNKPSEAEHELFVRATNMVETGLEKTLRELKGDKYLGDADWNIVCRYLPVPTPQIYWRRVQAGNIQLNQEELDLIGAYVKRGVEGRAGAKATTETATAAPGDASFGSSLLRWLRGGHWSLVPGSKYEDLPPKLRNRWRRYTIKNNELEGVVHGDKLAMIREATYEELANPLVLPPEKGAGQGEAEKLMVVDGTTGTAIDAAELKAAAMMDDFEEDQQEEVVKGTGKGKGTTEHKSVPTASVVPMTRTKSFTVAVAANQPRMHKGHMDAPPSLTPPGSEQEVMDVINEDEEMEGGKAGGSQRRLPHSASFDQSLAEARLRLMTVLKHVYWGSFQSGLLSPTGIRAFDSNMALLVLNPHKKLDEWTPLEERVLLPLRAVQASQRWGRLPLVGRVVQKMLFKRLAFFFELVMVFIEAHSNMDLEGLFGSGPVQKELSREVDDEVLRAKAALKEFLPVFPDIINSVKTEIASRYMLHKYRSLLEHAVESGSLERKEYDAGIAAVDASSVKLYDHSHTEKAAPRAVILNNLSFLRFLSQEEKLTLFGVGSKLCRDVYVRSETTFMSKGDTQLKGWYVIVRGSVLSGFGDGGAGVGGNEDDESLLQNGAIIGFIEALLQSPTQPLAHSYTAASFVHLLYFDRAAILHEAERHPALARSLWWLLAAFELRQDEALGLQSCSMNQLGALLAEESLMCVPAHRTLVAGKTLNHSPSTSADNVAASASVRGLPTLSENSTMEMKESASQKGMPHLTGSSSILRKGFRGVAGGLSAPHAHQLLESDGNGHLVLIAGKAEGEGEEGTEGKHVFEGPPVRVVPFLPEGRWTLSRGSVAFYLNEDKCQALVSPAKTAAGGGGGSAAAAPMMYRFTSMVGPRATKSAPEGSGPLLIYPMALKHASESANSKSSDSAAAAKRRNKSTGHGVTWGEDEDEGAASDGSDDEAAVGALLKQRMSQMVSSRRL